MIEVQENNAEAKIKEAAEELFAEHGMKGTTIRKVAEKADVNVALVNYYFRSKEKLFLSIFEEKFNTYIQSGIGIITDRSKDFWTRVEDYVTDLMNALKQDAHLPIFIMSETHYDPTLLSGIKGFNKDEIQMKAQKIQEVLDEEYEKGNIRKVLAIDFEFSMSSMILFPFLTKNILEHTGRIENEFKNFDDFLNHTKSNIIVMIRNFLKN